MNRLRLVLLALGSLLALALEGRGQFELKAGNFNNLYVPPASPPEGGNESGTPATPNSNFQGMGKVAGSSGPIDVTPDDSQPAGTIPPEYKNRYPSDEDDKVVLTRSTIGGVFVSGIPRYFLGDEITPPLVQADGSTPALPGYWRGKPVLPGESIPLVGPDILFPLGSVTVTEASTTGTIVKVASVPSELVVGATILGQPVTRIEGTTVTLAGNANFTIPSGSSTPVDITRALPFYYSPHAEKVYAHQPGQVVMTWVTRVPTSGSDHETLEEVFSVASNTRRPVRTIFWTKGGFDGPVVQVTDTRITTVNPAYNVQVPKAVGEEVEIPGNEPLIPTLTTLSFDKFIGIGQLHAYNVEGRILIEYLGNVRLGGNIHESIGTDVVDIVRVPPVHNVTVNLGKEIRPHDGDNALAASPVLSTTQDAPTYYGTVARPDGSSSFWAERETSAPAFPEDSVPAEPEAYNKVIFYWLEEGHFSIQWPKFRDRYWQRWSPVLSDYAHYTVDSTGSTRDDPATPQNEDTGIPFTGGALPTIVYQDDPDEREAVIDPATQRLYVTFANGADQRNRALLKSTAGSGKVWYVNLYTQAEDRASTLASTSTTPGAATIVTVASTAGLETGMIVTGPGITGAATILAITSTTTFVLSQNIADATNDLTYTVESDGAAPINAAHGATAIVGTRLAPPPGHELGGYIAGGTGYYPAGYLNPFVAGIEAANSGAIIPVNALPDDNLLTVRWFRKVAGKPSAEFQDFYVPGKVGRYPVSYPPTTTPQIVIAEGVGTNDLPPWEAAGSLYYQNNEGIGYNPNEEHAKMLGGRAYALRDDLNVTSDDDDYTSEPFVLLAYTDPGDNRPAIHAYQVVREIDANNDRIVDEGDILFDYVAEAGNLLVTPYPLPLLDLPLVGGVSKNLEIIGADDAANDTVTANEAYKSFTFQDRKGFTWVHRGPHDGGRPGVRSSNSDGAAPKSTITVDTTEGLVPGMTVTAPHATATATLTGGAVTGISISDGGSLYAAAPTVTLSAPDGGTTATATAMVSGGAVTGFTITDGGTGYSTPPTVTIEPSPPATIDSITNVTQFVLSTTAVTGTNAFTYGPMLSMKLYYLSEAGFFVPPGGEPAIGTILPFLRDATRSGLPLDVTKIDAKADGTLGGVDEPLTIVYRPTWPSDAPELRVGETLTLPKFGLPQVRGQASAQVLYEQSIANAATATLLSKNSVTLHDPTREKTVALDDSAVGLSALPTAILTTSKQGKTYFQGLAPHLQQRFYFDPLRGAKGTLVFVGEFHDVLAGEDYLDLNVLTATEETSFKDLVPSGADGKANWDAAIDALNTVVETFIPDPALAGSYKVGSSADVGENELAAITNKDTAVDSYAVTATGQGAGFVTMVFGDGGNPDQQPQGDPVQVQVFKVAEQLYVGDLKVVLSSNPLDEQVTLRHSGDFAAKPEDYEFDWRWGTGAATAPATYESVMTKFLGDPGESSHRWIVVSDPGNLDSPDYTLKLKSTSDGTTTVTVPTTARLTPGMLVTGSGIASTATITSITDNTHYVLSQVLAAASNDLTYARPALPFSEARTVNVRPVTFGDAVTTVTVPTTTDLTVGMSVTGPGITGPATVESIVDATRYVLSKNIPDGINTFTYDGSFDLISASITRIGDVIEDESYTEAEIAAGYPGVFLKSENGIDFGPTPFPLGIPDEIVFSARLGSFDGFVLYVNGRAALAYNAPEPQFALTNASSGLTDLGRAGAGGDDTLAQFSLAPSWFNAGPNTIELAIYTTADANAMSSLEFLLEAGVEADLVVATGSAWQTRNDPAGINTNTAIVGGSPTNPFGGPQFVLNDRWFTMRYRPKVNSGNLLAPNGVVGQAAIDAAQATVPYSRWMPPQFVEGWVKRVLAAINPFGQRVTDLYNNAVNTDVSVIAQAGPRWEGDVALTLSNINDVGLIEIYETVLNRARSFSIDANTNDPDSNDALLLVAGYLNDLYVLLGNEAFADAANPTISIDDPSTVTEVNTSRFSFEGQVANSLDEELALLRGRDDSVSPGVDIAPFYNRLYWNYTRGIVSGEVIYAVNYNIKEQVGSETADGIIDEEDAARMFPQGHGDAYGHYLTALTGYYRLLTNRNFTWTPRAEAVTVAGQAVTVDFQDERKFAAAAHNVARTAEQVVALVHRQDYEDDPAVGWEQFNDESGGWGLDQWVSRSAQGAYYHWAVANALVPDEDTYHTGVQKIDRTTVPEIAALAAVADSFQTTIDNANAHLNPLGLSPGAIAFDISPSEMLAGRSHFEQIYDRALAALNNASGAFNQAATMTRSLRDQQNQIDDYTTVIEEQEGAYVNELIDIFGRPYSGQIGAGKTYAQGYTGPDLVNWFIVDRPSDLADTSTAFKVDITTVQDYEPFTGVPTADILTTLQASGTRTTETVTVQPSQWVQYNDVWEAGGLGSRAETGELQDALQDAQETLLALQVLSGAYDDTFTNLKHAAAVYRDVIQTHLAELEELKTEHDKIGDLTRAASEMESLADGFEYSAELADLVGEAIAESYPGIFGVIAGTAAGTIADITSAARSATRVVAAGTADVLSGFALASRISARGRNNAILDLEQDLERSLADLGFKSEELQLAYEFDNLYREHTGHAVELMQAVLTHQRALQQVQNVLARGNRLLADREVFRQRAAAIIQGYRTRDLTFRLFRNEALEQYRTLFDLSSRYTYLAAKSYDYETGLLGSSEGQAVFSDIVASRALGDLTGGQPQATTSTLGDAGLAGTMAQLNAEFAVAEGRLGINNPDQNGTVFSLRHELYRLLDDPDKTSDDDAWQQTLEQHMVANVLTDADVASHCNNIAKPDGTPVPGIVIPFSTTIQHGRNYFGLTLAGGDHAFTPSNFATKIYNVGISLPGYVGMDRYAAGERNGSPSSNDENALSATPYVYLIPCGNDYMLAPPLGDTNTLRSWKVHDQALPLPFNLGATDFNANQFFSADGTLSEQPWILRKHPAFRAVSDPTFFYSSVPAEFTNSRLIGRSVWNSRWKLVIPAYTLLSDEQTGLDHFAASVEDIQLFLRTYSNSGN